MQRFTLRIAGPALLLGAVLHAQDLTGTWQGTLSESHTQNVRTILKISKAVNGVSSGELYRLDPDVGPIPVTSVVLQGKTVRFAVLPMDVTYEGKLNVDGASIAGTWTHFSTPHALNLVRVTDDSGWTIPTSSAGARQMPATAEPAFEVATVKPNAPDHQRKNMDFEGRHLTLTRFSVNDLLAFAYGLHARQIVGAPAWFETDVFDIDGIPDVEGEPSIPQIKTIVRKLLADRFKLVFHRDTKVLAVYAITVLKGGPKLTASANAANAEYDFSFPRKFGALTVRNLTLVEFGVWMQAVVLDKPVVDDTGLPGRYDFNLNWTPDESQVAKYGGNSSVPPPADDSNAPPGLYTAIQEQLGLKLTPVKESVSVIVVDHVEKPSSN